MLSLLSLSLYLLLCISLIMLKAIVALKPQRHYRRELVVSCPTLQHVVCKILPFPTSVFFPNQISLSNSERKGCCQRALQAWKNRWPSAEMVSLH